MTQLVECVTCGDLLNRNTQDIHKETRHPGVDNVMFKDYNIIDIKSDTALEDTSTAESELVISNTIDIKSEETVLDQSVLGVPDLEHRSDTAVVDSPEHAEVEDNEVEDNEEEIQLEEMLMESKEHEEEEEEMLQNVFVTCPTCSVCFSNTSTLITHISNAHKATYDDYTDNNYTDDKPYEILSCSACSFQTTEKHTLSVHLIEHVKHENLTCNICPFETPDKDEMIQHMTSKHLEKFEPTSHELNRDMTLENEILNSAIGLASVVSKKRCRISPQQISIQPKSLKCPHCPYMGGSIGRMTVHIKDKHTAVKQFKCERCEYETSRKAHLERHVLNKHTTTEVKTRQCKCCHCEYVGFDKWTLNRHLRDKHAGVKPFKCLLCNFSTVRRHRLTLHGQNMHTKENNVKRDKKCRTKDKKYRTKDKKCRNSENVKNDPEDIKLL